MSEDNGTTSVEVTKEGVKLAGKRTAELIAVFSLCLMAVGAYAFWKHEESTKSHQADMKEVLTTISMGIRESNCINTFKEEIRETKSEFCKRQSK